MNNTIELTGTDAIRVTESNQVVAGQVIIDKADYTTKQKAHRDAIQIIPTRQDGTFNTQFAGACIHGIEIRNNTVESDGQLQGVFCSDGMIDKGWITDNTLDTKSEHSISLCMLSGHIANNRNRAGELVPVKLYPLRIGGNSDGRFNVWVLSFKDGQYRYDSASKIVKDSSQRHVVDYRFGGHRNKGDIYLREFDLDGFMQETKRRQLTADQMRDLSLKYGIQDTDDEIESGIITGVDTMWKQKESKKNHMQIAQAEQGISEIPGADHNKRIVNYFQSTDYKATDDETPWCSAFVNWVLMQAGMPRTKSAAALSFKSWGVECDPHYGCVVVIPRGSWKGHVGFLVSSDDNYYHILGGNQNDQVNVASFSKQDHQFYFRCQKSRKDSSSLKVDAGRIAGGGVIAGGGAYEAMKPVVNPDTGHDTAPVESAPDLAEKVVSFIPPDGYLLLPEWFAYGLIVLGLLIVAASWYTRKERTKKIESFGI